jgi:hypothetical protein
MPCEKVNRTSSNINKNSGGKYETELCFVDLSLGLLTKMKHNKK